MQRLAECILEACSALPDSELTAPVEADARRNAKILFRQSVDAYHKVGSLQHLSPASSHRQSSPSQGCSDVVIVQENAAPNRIGACSLN